MTSEEKLDEIYNVVIRTEVQVEALMQADSHTRITKLEVAHKFWKQLVVAIAPVATCLFAVLKYLNVL